MHHHHHVGRLAAVGAGVTAALAAAGDWLTRHYAVTWAATHDVIGVLLVVFLVAVSGVSLWLMWREAVIRPRDRWLDMLDRVPTRLGMIEDVQSSVIAAIHDSLVRQEAQEAARHELLTKLLNEVATSRREYAELLHVVRARPCLLDSQCRPLLAESPVPNHAREEDRRE